MPGSRDSLAVEAAALDLALRRHHSDGAPSDLSRLHVRAAEMADGTGARRFHLTQAWVYALVAGEASAVARLEEELKALGGL